MCNNTYWKYVNIYSANRGYNPVFDEWLEKNYTVTVGTDPWNWGREDFVSKSTGESLSDAKIMQQYCKTHLPYFKDFGDRDAWIDSGCPDLLRRG